MHGACPGWVEVWVDWVEVWADAAAELPTPAPAHTKATGQRADASAFGDPDTVVFFAVSSLRRGWEGDATGPNGTRGGPSRKHEQGLGWSREDKAVQQVHSCSTHR